MGVRENGMRAHPNCDSGTVFQWGGWGGGMVERSEETVNKLIYFDIEVLAGSVP